MKTTKMLTILVVALGLMVCSSKVTGQVELGTAFTYQGFLKNLKNDKPADVPHDFQFSLFDANDAGTQVSDIVPANDVNVIDGYFMVRLDFGADVFAGYKRWLQIDVRGTDSGDPFTILTPRLELTLTPYAIYALSAGDANTVDGHHANAFAASVHNHDGSDINSGTVAEAYIDGTITRDSELASGLAGKADVGHAHDDRYYTETELQTSGSANVHWDNLLATMPAGFADGVDNEGGVPSGVIVMWSGAIGNIPSGWALCDGTNGTPDLTSRFIRSVPNASTDPGLIGGSTTHTHSGGSYSAGGHSHTYSGTTSQGDAIEYCNSGSQQVPARITHRHTYSGTTSSIGGGTVSGTSGNGNSLPPFFELAFIMRTGS